MLFRFECLSSIQRNPFANMNIGAIALLALIAAFATVEAGGRCSRPRSLPYGYISYGKKSSYKPGHVIGYKCNSGYRLVGHNSIKCLSRSNRAYWNRKLPVCQKIHIKGTRIHWVNLPISCLSFVFLQRLVCGRLQDPRNGDVDLKGITVGSKASYSCDHGFDLKGNRIRTCQLNGRWSGMNPFCKRIINTSYTVLTSNIIFVHCRKSGQLPKTIWPKKWWCGFDWIEGWIQS